MEKLYRRNPFIKVWGLVTSLNALAFIYAVLWTILVPTSVMGEFILVCMGISFAGTLISAYLFYINKKADKAQRELFSFIDGNVNKK